ncbi:hypothetical protein GCM10023116_36960 [Kistimonas scapharcae]|uniref:DUF3106 domain-containing protein n=1 Tax=Kistimonas scapharcae TaxID=1036133 RepID=A0ABP8V6G9_9GAMM
MTDKRLSFAIIMAGFMLFGSEAMAQSEDHSGGQRVTKEQLKNMTPEQRRAWWQSLSPEQREKIKEKRRAKGEHKGHNHPRGKAGDHDGHDHERSGSHKKYPKKHDDHDHGDDH